MKAFGIRCSNTDFAFAIMTGSKVAPVVKTSQLISYPKSYSKPQRLKWFFRELQDITRDQELVRWAIKGAEPMATRNKAFVERVEYEGVAILVAADFNIDEVPRKVKATIAKDLGLAGKAAALKNSLNTGLIPGFAREPEKIQEAILVSWSELN